MMNTNITNHDKMDCLKNHKLKKINQSLEMILTGVK